MFFIQKTQIVHIQNKSSFKVKRNVLNGNIMIMYTHRKKLSITCFCNESLQKAIHFLSPDHTEIFRVCIWKVCQDAAKINKVQMISFLSYGRYKLPCLIFFFNFPKCKVAFGILHNTEGNFGKQT